GAVQSDDDGIAGPDADEPAEGELVYGFIDRDAPGITVSDEWDVLGMRASQSRATVVDGVVMRPARVSRVIPAGKHPERLTRASPRRPPQQLRGAHRRGPRGPRRPGPRPRRSRADAAVGREVPLTRRWGARGATAACGRRRRVVSWARAARGVLARQRRVG